jgi:hypothetical protein
MSQSNPSNPLSYKLSLCPEGDVRITNKFSVINQSPGPLLPAKIVRNTNIVIFSP